MSTPYRKKGISFIREVAEITIKHLHITKEGREDKTQRICE